MSGLDLYTVGRLLGYADIGSTERYVDPDAGECLRRSTHAPAHGSTISISMSTTSRTLRVATAMPRERAMAAI